MTPRKPRNAAQIIVTVDMLPAPLAAQLRARIEREFGAALPHVCLSCFRSNTIVPLPPALLAKQPDSTTHVCHPTLGGCNHGFESK